MDEPFVYIASYTVKPGKLDEARRITREVGELVEAEEPQLIAFHIYLDEARERVITVQVHPDRESMATHMHVVARHLATAWDWLDTTIATQALGPPPEQLVRYAAEYGEPLDVYATRLTGFTRAAQPTS
jgi:hypothetical protein